MGHNLAQEVTVIWQNVIQVEPNESPHSPLDRFQEIVVGETSVASLISTCELLSSRDVKLSGIDGYVLIPEELLTTFSSHFKKLFKRGTMESYTGKVSMSLGSERNVSVATLAHMVQYIEQGKMPDHFDELHSLYELAKRIGHSYMAGQAAETLVNKARLLELITIVEEASKEPAGILYRELLKYLAARCESRWFNHWLQHPGRISLSLFRDLLRRDDLWVASEIRVLMMIDTWLTAHPDVTIEEFVDVVRLKWLPIGALVMHYYKLRNSLVSFNHSPLQYVQPRIRYLRHVHFVAFASEPHDVTRLSIATLCASDASERPQCLASADVSLPAGSGLVTRSPYKVVSFERFGKLPIAAAFMKTAVGLVSARPGTNADLLYSLYSLEQYTQGHKQQLMDISACGSGLLVYLRTISSLHDRIVRVDQATGAEAVIADFKCTNVPNWEPRMELRDDGIHIGNRMSEQTVVLDKELFTVERVHINGLIFSPDHVIADDLGEVVRGTSSVGDEFRQRYCTFRRPFSNETPPESHERKFRVICQALDGGQGDQPRTTVVRRGIDGTELLRFVGLSRDRFLGFVPHRLLTVNRKCQPLPLDLVQASFLPP